MSPGEVQPSALSLKKALLATWAEVVQDLKALGHCADASVLKAQSPSLPKKLPTHPRCKHRRMSKMEDVDLAPFLGLATFMSDADTRRETSSESTPTPPVKTRTTHKGFLADFLPGKLRRSATHAAIAYFIWHCFQSSKAGTQ